MIVAFELSMPGAPSWSGRWSGEGTCYAIVKSFTSKADIAKAERMVAAARYSYRWSDGWMASVSVRQVTSAEAAKLRKKSRGFCGYDWMVTSIIRHDRILVEGGE